MYLMIAVDLAMTIKQAKIAKNIDEIQAQAVELHKRFSTFIGQVQQHRLRHQSLEQELQCSGRFSAESVVAAGSAFCRAGRAKP